MVSAALFWAAASLLWSAAGAGYCSPALMRCLLGGSSWIVMMERPGHSVCVGALFSPAARGGSGELAASCIWNGCSELGTFEHICWCCPYRPPDLDIPPKPNEGLSSRYGWVITNQRADIIAVQDWLVYVQRLLWELAHPSA